jgi:hypothetical protein
MRRLDVGGSLQEACPPVPQQLLSFGLSNNRYRCPTLPVQHGTSTIYLAERLTEWNSEMVDVVGDLITCLTKTTIIFSQFQRDNVCYFITEKHNNYLTSIAGTSNTLKMKLECLKLLEDRLIKAKGPAVSFPFVSSSTSPVSLEVVLLTSV